MDAAPPPPSPVCGSATAASAVGDGVGVEGAGTGVEEVGEGVADSVANDGAWAADVG